MLLEKYNNVLSKFLIDFSIIHLHANNSLKLINYEGINIPPLY